MGRHRPRRSARVHDPRGDERRRRRGGWRLRLQLTLAAVALVARPAAADPPPEPESTATLRLYVDDDHVTVVSPAASARVTDGEATAVTVDATVDAISSASIDVLTAASPVEISELRVEAGAAVARALGGRWTGRARARGSHENDYDALRLGAGVDLELPGRQTSLALDYDLGLDRAGDVTDPAFDRRRTGHAVAARVSRIVDARTVLDLIVDAQRADGYHASPYRQVPIVDPAWPMPTWVDEETPRVRQAIAGTLRARRAIGDAWFAGASYRLHHDDWSITSHTASVDLRRQLGGWLLGVTARGYAQDGAWFYRRVYEGDTPDARTRDRTLGPMRTAFGSLTADRALGLGDAHLVVSCGGLGMWFLDSGLQARRLAIVTTASLHLPL